MERTGHAAENAIEEQVRASYRAWGIPDDLAERTTLKAFAAMLSSIEPKIRSRTCRVFVSSFDPNDPELRAFPRPIDWRWNSLERALRFWEARIVMTRLPHFWQLESPVHAACRNAGVPIFTNEVENMPVGAAAILSAGVDTVLCDVANAFAFTSHLSQKNIRMPRLWVLLHDVRRDSWDFPAPLSEGTCRVVNEVHLFPGVPLLEQCPYLALDGSGAYHSSSAYRLESEGRATLITSMGGDPFPLFRLEIPVALKETGLCECGRTMIERA